MVTGVGGQVGRAFFEKASKHHLVAMGHTALAIEDEAACERAVAYARPNWIVHPAAMTDVDACERDPMKAHLVNAIGAANLAKAAARHGSQMALVSTDYVFDGGKGNYKETDSTNPLSHYGRSKLEGERLVLEQLPDALVARTSVVFGPHKNNFVLWLRRSLRTGTHVKAARDQWVTPTCADDVACQILALLEADESGIWHTAGAERMSRLEMALRVAEYDGLDPSLITSVTMSELNWLAPRPRDSSLDTTKISRLSQPLSFRQALDTLGVNA
jgi:dTDP-4-dehydrorhamnose reductase